MFQAKIDESKNAKLLDVCLSTSAAPTYLPCHEFESNGNSRKFNMIDGGVAANNPVSSLKSSKNNVFVFN